MDLAEVRKSVPVPIDALWNELRDFSRVDRWYPKEGLEGIGQVARLEATGSSVGSKRTLYTVAGDVLKERYEAIDDVERTLSYSMEAPNLFGIEDYFATVSLKQVGEAETEVSWGSSGSLVDPASASVLREGLVLLYGTLIDGAAQCAKVGTAAGDIN